MDCYLNKIKNKLLTFTSQCKNILIKFFMKFLKIVLIILLISIFLLGSLVFFNVLDIRTPTDTQAQEIYIQKISLSNWCSWITLIGLIFTAIWSMHQYKKSKLSSQQEKAAQIATDFADNLIEKLGLISKTLLSDKQVQEIVNKLNMNSPSLSQFTTYEIEKIFGDKNIFDIYTKILVSDEIQKNYESLLNNKYSKLEQQKFNSKFFVLVESTLNHLEAICIDISSQAAGSQFIYESLHQHFLLTVQILAIIISKKNSDNIDKYYTNIIQVYNMWNAQKQKDLKRFKKI